MKVTFSLSHSHKIFYSLALRVDESRSGSNQTALKSVAEGIVLIKFMPSWPMEECYSPHVVTAKFAYGNSKGLAQCLDSWTACDFEYASQGLRFETY